jgi:enoyl-CoA hydratase/carnithine racemase
VNHPETFSVERTSDRVVIELSAPGRNAISLQMVHELHAVVEELSRAPGQILILTGANGVFAGGADIAQLRERTRDDALAAINLSLFERIRALPLPTIAAIDGFALGGGAELAYAFDVRIASTRAIFGQPESRLGIMAAAGGCYRLPALVGESLAQDMLFTGRRLTAPEALAAGLVSRVVEPDGLMAEAHAVADDMLCSSLIALRLTKLAIDSPPAAHPSLEMAAQAVLFDDDEKRARMDAFLERPRRAGTPPPTPAQGD